MRRQSKFTLLAENEGPLPVGEMMAILGLIYAAILLALFIGAGSIDLRALIEAMTVLDLSDPIAAAAFTA